MNIPVKARKSIAVWQPYFRGGGAEAVALWILEALYQEYDVTLHTLAPVDLAWLNSMYDTHLPEGSIKVSHYLSQRFEGSAYGLMARGEFFRAAFVYWAVKRFKAAASQYDLVFSAFNALDMGRSGIQYLHWVHVVDEPYDQAHWWQKALMRWADFSYERLESNYSIANSQYTADRVQKSYGIDSEVIFPPVITQIDALPWEEKENAFLCSGRIVQPKQTHRVIEILKAIRQRGFEVSLHITGGGGGVYQQAYLTQVEKLVDQNSDWITLHQNLPYDEYLKVVARCRYGIHYKPEPFGISIAEMLKANMLPFVRSKGGQMEIVGAEHEALLFKKQKDAVEKISAVLGDTALQESLRASLQARKALFSTEHFMKSIRTTVASYLQSAD